MDVQPPVVRCVHLRTKAMYIASMAGQAFAEEQEAPVCWCNRTLRELGPDGESAELQACSDAGRACHRSRPG